MYHVAHVVHIFVVPIAATGCCANGVIRSPKNAMRIFHVPAPWSL